MPVSVKSENEAYLNRLVAEGIYSSVEEAADAAIDALRLQDDDMLWAKPYIEEGIAQLDRGEGIPAEEVFARIRKRFEADQR